MNQVQVVRTPFKRNDRVNVVIIDPGRRGSLERGVTVGKENLLTFPGTRSAVVRGVTKAGS